MITLEDSTDTVSQFLSRKDVVAVGQESKDGANAHSQTTVNEQYQHVRVLQPYPVENVTSTPILGLPSTPAYHLVL
jgi:hypothetical protein